MGEITVQWQCEKCGSWNSSTESTRLAAYEALRAKVNAHRCASDLAIRDQFFALLNMGSAADYE